MEQIAVNPAFRPDWPTTLHGREDGRVESRDLNNGWASTTLVGQQDGVAVLTGGGFSFAFVNGVPYAGDPYGYGYLRIPVAIRRGENIVIVRSARGGFSFNVEDASTPAAIGSADALLPDLIAGEKIKTYGAVVVLNQSNEALTGAVLTIGDGKIIAKTDIKLPTLVPLALSKVPFEIKQVGQPDAAKGYDLPVSLRVGMATQNAKFHMNVRVRSDPHTVTRLSEIDGSVQYYAVRPPLDFRKDTTYALYLSLHGASVEATGQIGATYSKFGAYTVAPTNRRPYGFDWQEWGRLDALEALTEFQKTARIDPNRVYLTGHSMGGHGTWYMGAVYPDKWAAIGPSSGWISFFSYGGGSLPRDGTDATQGLELAKRESDTLALKQNYAGLPIYAIHGEKDDNVPVSEMRDMIKALEPWHPNLHWHEEPGAGHWFDGPEYPGAECMDYRPRNDFFERCVRPSAPTEVSFTTQNPSISADCFWVRVVRQAASGPMSKVTAQVVPGQNIVTVTTDNVATLQFDLMPFFVAGSAVTLKVDGINVPVASGTAVRVSKTLGGWRLDTMDDAGKKNPRRGGPFKLAFTNRMIWVYGTSGTPEENAASAAKARFDQQNWWYRGNGWTQVISDKDFDPAKHPGCNVILYGNADTNSAFGKVLSGCPINIRRGRVTMGERTFDGDVATYFCYPRSGTTDCLVGVVGASSTVAMRRIFDPRYFTSGVSLPDYVIFGDQTLLKGDGGVLASGYFDNLWK